MGCGTCLCMMRQGRDGRMEASGLHAAERNSSAGTLAQPWVATMALCRDGALSLCAPHEVTHNITATDAWTEARGGGAAYRKRRAVAGAVEATRHPSQPGGLQDFVGLVLTLSGKEPRRGYEICERGRRVKPSISADAPTESAPDQLATSPPSEAEEGRSALRIAPGGGSTDASSSRVWGCTLHFARSDEK